MQKNRSKIWSIQKKAVLLHPLFNREPVRSRKTATYRLLRAVSTRISVLHRILVPRSEVRLLGGQPGCARSLSFPQKRRRVMEYTVLSNTKTITQ